MVVVYWLLTIWSVDNIVVIVNGTVILKVLYNHLLAKLDGAYVHLICL